MPGPEDRATVYLDTSALGRVLLGEPDGAAVLDRLSEFPRRVASRLMRVELRRLALRHDLVAAADQLLTAVALVPVSAAVLDAAETVGPPSVATLDAIHLATALELHGSGALDAVMTYDRQLADGAAANGLRVLAPG